MTYNVFSGTLNPTQSIKYPDLDATILSQMPIRTMLLQ